MRLLLLFLIVPLIEIALFIQVGGIIGLGWTLLIVVATAIAGAWMVRSQGSAVVRQIRDAFEELTDPSEPLAHGAMILFSGALLLTPGFFTDAVGFALLVPGLRGRIFRFIRSRIRIERIDVGSRAAHRPSRDTVIDAEYEDVTDGASRAPSGWTRH